MGIPSGIAFHAWHRDGPDRRDDRRETPPQRQGRVRGAGAGLGLIAALLAAPAAAETLRIATYNPGLSRDGPGLLVADIRDGKAPDAGIAAAVIAAADPDILVLTGIDYDAGLVALDAFDRLIGGGTPAYPHRFALRPNTGLATGLDLDGDGRRGEPNDAQGFGRFAGQGGMAILSRLPIRAEDVRDLSAFLWTDLPGADLPTWPDGSAFPSAQARAAQRLSTTAHWDVPVTLPDGKRLHLLAWYASPPVFDGPEDRNGKRSMDEARLWLHYLDGGLGPAPESFVLIGDANLDPHAGDGDHAAFARFLADPRFTDPEPQGGGGLATADWPDPPGPLRVDYILPAATLTIDASGVFWPPPGQPLAEEISGEDAPAHRLVWLDLDLD